MTPLVSIVIPTFNRTDTISRAVESCLDQTYKEFEVLIVDDASTDGFEETHRSLFSDRRIRVIKHGRNQGVSASRNTGVQNARGDFVAFLDSDDSWHPTKLEKQVRYIQAHANARLLCGALTEVVTIQSPTNITPYLHKPRKHYFADFLFVYKARRRLRPVADRRAAHSKGLMIHVSSIILPTALALQVPFRTVLNQYEDFAFLIDVERKGIEVNLVEEPLVIHHDDPRPGRLGSKDDVDRGQRFITEMGDFLSPDARLAFEVSHLGHLYAKDRPLHAARMVLDAFFHRLISPRTVVGVLSRSMLGQGMHEELRDIKRYPRHLKSIFR